MLRQDSMRRTVCSQAQHDDAEDDLNATEAQDNSRSDHFDDLLSRSSMQGLRRSSLCCFRETMVEL
jgi:hypothetical protein